jgi:hypothetical protein
MFIQARLLECDRCRAWSAPEARSWRCAHGPTGRSRPDLLLGHGTGWSIAVASADACRRLLLQQSTYHRCRHDTQMGTNPLALGAKPVDHVPGGSSEDSCQFVDPHEGQNNCVTVQRSRTRSRAWRIPLTRKSPDARIVEASLGRAPPRPNMTGDQCGRKNFGSCKSSGSGSPLCQDTTARSGVGSWASPGSDCSEVLAMGIRSVALD